MADEYVSDAFGELFKEDGLVVMSRGLGLRRLVVKYLQHCCQSCVADREKNQKSVVFCINLLDNNGTTIKSDENSTCRVILEALSAENLSLEDQPKVITTETSPQERADLYNGEGGVFIITSRILIVDMLDNRINPENILGFLVPNAHKISEYSMEAFILRVFREHNETGFIKAFTEDPEPVSISGKVEALLKLLHVRKLYLYPRFQLKIIQTLAEPPQPQVEEIGVEMSKSMRGIQSAILVAMKSSLAELKKCQAAVYLDDLVNTENHGFFLMNHIDSMIKRVTMQHWHVISPRAKGLLSDLSDLRKLLEHLLRYDAYHFYYKLLKLKQTATDKREPSLWLVSEAANFIFSTGKDRVYRIIHQSKQSVDERLNRDQQDASRRAALNIDHVITNIMECPRKWIVLKDILREVFSKNLQQYKKDKEESHEVMIIVKDVDTLLQIRDFLLFDEKHVMDMRYRWFMSQKAAEIKSQIRMNQRLASTKRPKIYGFQPSSSEASELPAMNTHDLSGITLTDREMAALSAESKLILLEEMRLHSQVAFNGRIREDATVDDIYDSSTQHPDAKPGRKKRPLKDEDEDQDRDEEDEAESESGHEPCSSTSCHVDATHGHCFVITHNEALTQYFDVMEQLRPKIIIFYDTELSLIRNVETYQANINVKSMEAGETPQPLQVFVITYTESVEQHKYVDTLEREKKAFESLIKTKEILVIPEKETKRQLEAAILEDLDLVKDSRAINKELGVPVSSRKKHTIHIMRQREDIARRVSIVVDIREFRCALPSLLHSKNFIIIPRQVTVGDYILSSEICVERKSVGDLFSSFASGRLFKQAEAMSRHYKSPCVLIEFTESKSFSLQAVSDISNEVTSSSINTKLAVLALHFPNLRMLWARTPSDSVSIFASLVALPNQEPVDVERAVNVGAGQYQEESQSTTISAAGTLTRRTDDSISSELRLTANEMLMALPGINVHNFRCVVNAVSNLNELSQLSEADLAALIGPNNGRKLYEFFHDRRGR